MPSHTLAASSRWAIWWSANIGSTRSKSFSFTPHAPAPFNAMGSGLPSSSALRARARTRMSSASVQCTSTGASPSARRPSSTRSARGTWPSQVASLSLLVSKRATLSTAASTCSKPSSPAGCSSASFCISWCAASRLPSTRSAKKAKVRWPSSPAFTRWPWRARRCANQAGKALRSSVSTRTVRPAWSSAVNQAALICWYSSRGHCTRVSTSSLRSSQ